MRRAIGAVLLMSLPTFIGLGCGGSSPAAGEPLVSGALTGSYEGHPFAPAFGVAMPYMGGT